MTRGQGRASHANPDATTQSIVSLEGVNTPPSASSTSRHTAVSTAFVPRGVYTAIAGHAVSSIRHSSSQMFLLFLTRCACEWPCACQSHLAMLMSSIVAHAAMLIVLVSPGLLQTCLNIHALGSPGFFGAAGSHPCTGGENREYFRVSYDLRPPLARTCLNIHAFDCFNNIVILA